MQRRITFKPKYTSMVDRQNVSILLVDTSQ